jgi:hypothetical protein
MACNRDIFTLLYSESRLRLFCVYTFRALELDGGKEYQLAHFVHFDMYINQIRCELASQSITADERLNEARSPRQMVCAQHHTACNLVEHSPRIELFVLAMNSFFLY